MNKNVFWVWNGWGVLFTVVVIFWQFFHILVTEKIGSGTPIRNLLAFIMLVAVILTFVLSGWIAGLLSVPIGMISGVILAKLFIPHRE